ncbi:MAG: hemerythrin domain-containing protein [Vulcanimicrobiaceae bacterium]
MDVITLLKNDHREVQGMFDRAEDLGERAEQQRGRLGEQICMALEVHSKFEEQEFYPVFRERAEDHEEREQLLEALEEHGIVDRLVSELKSMNPSDERYEAKLMVVMESARHHIKEEEREMFPMVRELFEKEELIELGERFIEAKRRAKMPVR